MKHFDDFHEDQFDFHAYCVRKVTLRAYTEVLRFEDRLWGEDYYFRAARGIIGIYLHLYDHPDNPDDDKEPDYSNMTAAQKKKAKAIARKKRNLAEKKEAEKKKQEAEAAQNGSNKKGKTSAVDEDPEGKELLKLDPMEAASKYSSTLAKYSPKQFETWTLQYDVSIRRKKYLLALQSLFKMCDIDSTNGDYIARLVDFATKMSNFGELPRAVKFVIESESAKLLNQRSVNEFVSEVSNQVKLETTSNLPTRIAIAQSIMKVDPSSVEEAARIIVDGGVNCRGASVDSCRTATKVLQDLGDGADAATKQWIAIVKERFPLMTDTAND